MTAARAELLEWHDATGSDKPDADITVLVWLESGEWFSAWWGGESWFYADTGGDVQGVTHWAEPEGPPK